jgi:hypothetical protein
MVIMVAWKTSQRRRWENSMKASEETFALPGKR